MCICSRSGLHGMNIWGELMPWVHHGMPSEEGMLHTHARQHYLDAQCSLALCCFMPGKHKEPEGPTAVLLACVQSAIASTPSAAWQGYLLGGMMWFCIPFTLSTSLGLATVALDLPLSTNEANMGLVPIAAASVRTLFTRTAVCIVMHGTAR